MGDLATTVKGIGGFGTFLYVCMLAYVSWRTFQFLRGGPPLPLAPPSSRGFPAKKLFHLFLLASTLLDLIYYGKMANGGVTANSYCLHLLALWTELCAFGFMVVIWGRVLQVTKEKDALLTRVLALNAFTLIYTLVVICLVIVNQNSVDQFVSSSSQPYIFFFLVQGLVLLFFCISLLYHGLRLQNLVRNHPRWEPLRKERRLKIILKINGVLFVCGACFLLRTLLLFAHFLEAEAHQTAKFLDPAALVSWYVFANWIPFCVPTTLLLYMMQSHAGSHDRGSAGAGGLTLGLAKQAGTTETDAVGLREWEAPLVSPHSSGNSLLSREYWRTNLVNLYSPPQIATSSPNDDEEAAAAGTAAATLSAPAAAASAPPTRGGKKAAVLDLGSEVEEPNEEKARLLSSQTAPSAVHV